MQVRVSGWSTPREIILEKDAVVFEVAENDGCWICSARISHVSEILTRKKIPVNFRTAPSEYGARCLYIVLALPPEGVDVKRYVAETLNLYIS